jgi:hypothetical protein
MTRTILILLVSLLASGAAHAGEASSRYGKAVQKACVSDYKAYCGEYGIESPALRSCMDRNGQKLSHACVRALVAAGEVSQAEVNARKASGR